VGAYSNPYAVSVAESSDDARSAFLRQVGLWTAGGLLVAGATSVVSTTAVFLLPPLQNTWVTLGILFGSMMGAQAIGRTAVYSPSAGTRALGFAAGMALEGVAMGYLLLSAMLFSWQLYANPLVFLGEALVLVGLTFVGMIGYLLTGPKNLSMLGGILSATFLPMLALMVFGLVFPINGVIGILVSLLFVGLSAGGLLYNLNAVMYRMSTDQVVPAAYHVSMGILTLFWNVVTLLMKLQRR
jgi:FtsH-binding integral membrane protein